MSATSYRRKRSSVDNRILLATTTAKGCSPALAYWHMDAACAVAPTPHPRHHPLGPPHPPAGSRRPSHRGAGSGPRPRTRRRPSRSRKPRPRRPSRRRLPQRRSTRAAQRPKPRAQRPEPPRKARTEEEPDLGGGQEKRSSGGAWDWGTGERIRMGKFPLARLVRLPAARFSFRLCLCCVGRSFSRSARVLFFGLACSAPDGAWPFPFGIWRT